MSLNMDNETELTTGKSLELIAASINKGKKGGACSKT
jgi:hypothetical protein